MAHDNLLDHIRIAAPCSASWEAMEGGDRVRSCALCQQNVYNLSGMSRREAETLVRQCEGRLCVRFYRRRDGTVLTDNCPVGLRRARRWLLTHLTGTAALIGGLLALTIQSSPLVRIAPLQAFSERLSAPPPAPPVVMGSPAPGPWMGQMPIPQPPPPPAPPPPELHLIPPMPEPAPAPPTRPRSGVEFLRDPPIYDGANERAPEGSGR